MKRVTPPPLKVTLPLRSRARPRPPMSRSNSTKPALNGHVDIEAHCAKCRSDDRGRRPGPCRLRLSRRRRRAPGQHPKHRRYRAHPRTCARSLAEPISPVVARGDADPARQILPGIVGGPLQASRPNHQTPPVVAPDAERQAVRRSGVDREPVLRLSSSRFISSLFNGPTICWATRRALDPAYPAQGGVLRPPNCQRAITGRTFLITNPEVLPRDDGVGSGQTRSAASRSPPPAPMSWPAAAN